MVPPVATGELVLVPVATSAPSISVLYRAEHVAMVRRLVLIGSPLDLAEAVAHRAFVRVEHEWATITDPLTAVRRIALHDVVSRFRPTGKAPTRTPPRDSAPSEWRAVAPVLDPLAPSDRAAAVLRIYDGLDDATIADLVPGRRRVPLPDHDPTLAAVFADAVADVSPASRLTELIGAHQSTTVDRTGETRRAPSRAWLGLALGAFGLVSVFGGRVNADFVAPGSGRPQDVRVGLDRNGGVVLPVRSGADESSCPAADPSEGPGGTPLPHEGDTYPDRVARVLATDRRAIVALHRGAVDARILHRGGRVIRTGAGGGRVRNIDGGDDQQIQIVIEQAASCPAATQSWKGVPLVFTTAHDTHDQPDLVVDDTFRDGSTWEVRDRPGVGLCARVGSGPECGEAAGDGVDPPMRLASDGAGHTIVYGYLPPNATTARLEWEGGRRLGTRYERQGEAMFFALAVEGGPADRIAFFDPRGAAVAAEPYPSS